MIRTVILLILIILSNIIMYFKGYHSGAKDALELFKNIIKKAAEETEIKLPEEQTNEG